MEPNTQLKDQAVTGLFSDLIFGSESVASGPPGTSSVTMIDRVGNVWIADEAPANGEKEEEETVPPYRLRPGQPSSYIGPGRPLGFKYDAEGNLIVCDSLKGLVMLEGGSGKLMILANRVSPSSAVEPGSVITYANDLDIDPVSGTVYFSDSHNITTALNAEGYYDTFQSFMMGLYAVSVLGGGS